MIGNVQLTSNQPASPFVYLVVGFDDCDKPTAISIRQSATDALQDMQAAKDQFRKVSVNNSDGVEMFSTTLIHQAYCERTEVASEK